MKIVCFFGENMPTYIYQTRERKKSCPKCRKSFEVEQSIREESLNACPDCGNPVQRVITPCSFARTDSTKTRLSNENLKKHGFTKLVNEGDGKYRKVT